MFAGIFGYAGEGRALYFSPRGRMKIQGERPCSCAISMPELTTFPTPARLCNYPDFVAIAAFGAARDCYDLNMASEQPTSQHARLHRT
jgi:hypothetical protein